MKMTKALMPGVPGAIEIREESAADDNGIRHVLVSAFPTDAEARLVDRLRQSFEAWAWLR